MSAKPNDSTSAKAKIAEAAAILSSLDFPLGKDDFRTKLRQDRICLVLLAVADLSPSTPWKSAKVHGEGGKSHAPRTRDIINFLNKNYGTTMSSGSYDDIRRKNLDYLVEAGLVVPSARRAGASTNDGTRGYAISKDAAPLLHEYGSSKWPALVKQFRNSHVSLSTALQRPVTMQMVEVTFPDGQNFQTVDRSTQQDSEGDNRGIPASLRAETQSPLPRRHSQKRSCSGPFTPQSRWTWPQPT